MRNYTRWTSPEGERRLRSAVTEANSFTQVLEILELVKAGGNFANIKHHIARLDLDTSHHLGQAWRKEIYKDRGYSTNASCVKYLIRKHGRICWSCGLTNWSNSPIPLELNHIDGNSFNFDEDNLELLCCNCHAQTETWRRRKSV